VSAGNIPSELGALLCLSSLLSVTLHHLALRAKGQISHLRPSALLRAD
jgi:hypothetical protein